MTNTRRSTRRRSPEARPREQVARSVIGLKANPEDLLSIDRRRFLESSGFALFLTALAGCTRAPVRHILSSPVGEEGAAAGLPRSYSSTCGGCPAGCGVVVKTRDGRPIKLEGNPDHQISRGGLCAVGQAEVLGLYDSERLREPLLDGKKVDWQTVDKQVDEQLAVAKSAGRSICLLTGTIHSPTTRAAIDRFLAEVTGSRHVVYDPLSASAIGDAYAQTHGIRSVPRYRFDRADVIVSLGADFLGTWISPVEYTAAYASGRTPEGDPPRMSYHLQVESRMSLTGSNADDRWSVPPSGYAALAARIAVELAGRSGREISHNLPTSPVTEAKITALVDRMWNARGRTLVVCDSQDAPTQIVCNFINDVLDAYGNTVEIAASRQRQGESQSLAELVGRLEEGKVGVLVISGVNPIYDLPIGPRLADLIENDEQLFVLRLGQHADETATVATCVCPESHWLESWGDAEPVTDIVSLCQPTLATLGSSRSLLECLLAWTSATAAKTTAATAAYDAIREHWQESILPRRAKQELDTEASWECALRQGVIELQPTKPDARTFDASPLQLEKLPTQVDEETSTLILYPKVGLFDGRPALNPWLQELPDPVTKVTWDNYACLSPDAAEKLGIEQGDLVRLHVDGVSIELPVLIQVGQHDKVVAVALGYGRAGTDRFTKVGPQWIEARPTVGPNGLVGVNAAQLLAFDGGTIGYMRAGVRVESTGGRRALATTQQHHSLSVPAKLAMPGTEYRPIVEQTTLDSYRLDPLSGAAHHHHFEGELWPDDHPYPGHRWGMVIDLNKCSGCSACVVACQAENNVPVVGRDEVLRSREMHWIRVDRYYDGGADGVTALHQPMLCHHCGHAPCENVCPVLATVHSEEGLNQQVYNRCVGTRYCANNCPYKVRRFNWFEYSRPDRLENAALNPDITVRSRGVMEKCSFCIQRIQEATLEAKYRGDEITDDMVQTACQQSCPAGAIVFGDMNAPESAVAIAAKAGRHFQVLAELNVHPSVGYLRVVHNRKEQSLEKHHD